MAFTGFFRASGFASPLGDSQSMKGRDKRGKFEDAGLKGTGLNCEAPGGGASLVRGHKE